MPAEYTKIGKMTAVEDALDNVLLDEKIYDKPALRDALLASGVTVRLQGGQIVWVACQPNDDPNTHQVEMLAVAIAGNAQGGPMVRVNGHITASLFARGIDPAVVASQGMDSIRRDMMRTVLGLEPEDEEAEQRLGLNAHERAQRSIQTRLKVAVDSADTLKDVL